MLIARQMQVMPTRAPSCIAVNNACRYLFSAAASAFVLPLVVRTFTSLQNPSLIPVIPRQNKVGIGWTNTLSAALCWVGFGLILLTMRYGERMRELGAKWEGLETGDETGNGKADSKSTLVAGGMATKREQES